MTKPRNYVLVRYDYNGNFGGYATNSVFSLVANIQNAKKFSGDRGATEFLRNKKLIDFNGESDNFKYFLRNVDNFEPYSPSPEEEDFICDIKSQTEIRAKREIERRIKLSIEEKLINAFGENSNYDLFDVKFSKDEIDFITRFCGE